MEGRGGRGLSEGGRSVGAIVQSPALQIPAAVILDSTGDDLDIYYADPAVWAEEVEGLRRIWPDGRAASLRTRLGNAALPETTHLVFSSTDPNLPAGIMDELVAHVPTRGGTVTDTASTKRLQLADDLDLAREVVADVLGVGGGGTDDTDP